MIADEQIKTIFVKHGFKLSNETGDDLKQYVYDAARELIALAQEVEPLKFVRCDGSPDDLCCQTSIGKYVIFKFNKGYLVGIDGVVVADRICKASLAIEAAQQDYAKRVRSGLIEGAK